MRALITGANGDIGYAILKYLLEKKFYVIAMDNKVDRLDEISRNHENFNVIKVDLTNYECLDKAINSLTDPIDIFIYAAGIREITPLTHLSLSEWKKVLDVNLTGAFVLSKYTSALAIKNKKPLCIIYISSISGLHGEPERGAYCASKHGLIGLTKALAIELAHYEIRVNAIAPGIIETDLTKPYQKNHQIMNQINNNIPLARWGQPRHIVKTVDMLLNNDYITGSTLVVDGGWTAGKII